MEEKTSIFLASMEFGKKFVVALFVLFVLILLTMSFIALKNNITAKDYSEYWQEESLTSGSQTLIVMGDSTGIGVGASSPNKSFVGHVKNSLEDKIGGRVRVVNVAFANATIQDVIQKQIPILNEHYPDILIIAVGRKNVDNNDFNRELFERLFTKIPTERTYILEVASTYDNKKDRIIKEYNALLRDVAGLFNVDVVPLYQATSLYRYDLTYYDWDFVHPNDKGHAIWAREILKEL